MSGCFGNDPVDRWIEGQLFQYLKECDEVHCEHCDEVFNIEELTWDKEFALCPNCKEEVGL